MAERVELERRYRIHRSTRFPPNIELVSGGTAFTARVTEVFVTVNIGNSIVHTHADESTCKDTNKGGGGDDDWNPENLMTSAKANRVEQQKYTYDRLGRRVTTQEPPSGALGPPKVPSWRVLWDPKAAWADWVLEPGLGAKFGRVNALTITAGRLAEELFSGVVDEIVHAVTEPIVPHTVEDSPLSGNHHVRGFGQVVFMPKAVASYARQP